MYLSRVLLPLTNAATHAILADIYALHRTLMTALPTPPGRMLFRVEPVSAVAPDAVILVQSEQPPRWFGIPPLRVSDPVKRIAFEFQAGREYRFRLRANPSVKKRLGERPNGARVAVLGEQRQFEWLRRKGDAGGFVPQQCIIKDEKTISGSKASGAHELSFRSILFEGTLQVTDAVRFRHAVECGIGSAKAFGFGLLSLS